MAANLIRVVRGAGKPFEIAENAQTFIPALVKDRDVAGDLAVMDQFPAMLSIGAKDYLRRGLDGEKLDEALPKIGRSGALSRLRRLAGLDKPHRSKQERMKCQMARGYGAWS